MSKQTSNPKPYILYMQVFSHSSNQPILPFVWFPLPMGNIDWNIAYSHAIPCCAAIILDLKWNVIVPEKWQYISSLWSNESSVQIFCRHILTEAVLHIALVNRKTFTSYNDLTISFHWYAAQPYLNDILSKRF